MSARRNFRWGDPQSKLGEKLNWRKGPTLERQHSRQDLGTSTAMTMGGNRLVDDKHCWRRGLTILYPVREREELDWVSEWGSIKSNRSLTPSSCVRPIPSSSLLTLYWFVSIDWNDFLTSGTSESKLMRVRMKRWRRREGRLLTLCLCLSWVRWLEHRDSIRYDTIRFDS